MSKQRMQIPCLLFCEKRESPTAQEEKAPSISPMRGSAQLWFSDFSDQSDLSDQSDPSETQY